MNAPGFGYTNVVSLADTQRISGNMILSDFNKSGVAHAPKTTPVLAIAADYSAGRSAIRNAGAVALATASTQAPTVRQHGGGRARSTLRTQQPSGRPTRSTGGEINSLCCAAAGIIAPAFRHCRSHAYPLTGVRRAAHPAAPLRSTPRPHAQPVKGYTHQKTSQEGETCQPPLRRPFTRSNVPGVLCMSLLTPHCDICNRPRTKGNHTACSRKRQAMHRAKWEVQQ